MQVKRSASAMSVQPAVQFLPVSAVSTAAVDEPPPPPKKKKLGLTIKFKGMPKDPGA